VGLVLGIFPVAKGGGLGVEGQSQILGLALPEDLEKHIGDPERGVGGETPGGGKTSDSVKGPVNVGADVQEVEDPGSHNLLALLVPLYSLPPRCVKEGEEMGQG